MEQKTKFYKQVQELYEWMQEKKTKQKTSSTIQPMLIQMPSTPFNEKNEIKKQFIRHEIQNLVSPKINFGN